MAIAPDIKVISTQAPKEAYTELVAQFEAATGHTVATSFTGTLNVAKRLADGERCDTVIMSSSAMDEQIGKGRIVSGSKVRFVSSGIGIAVRKGAPKPDIGTAEALKKTLLAAKSIGISTGPSGVYLIEMFRKMGIADAIKDKLRQTPSGVFVGTLIAGGEAEIGFQQVSELVHHPGIDFVGPLPAEVQNVTTFCAAIHSGAAQPATAAALIGHITAPAAAPIIRKHGLEPG
jgi:molybdate transport system substrate-binding protein